MTVEARHIRTTEDLASLLPAWRELYARVPGALPFQSPDWLMAWWEAFRPGALVTVAVFADDRLEAVAPLWFEAGAHGRRVLPMGIGLSDYFDVLMRPDVPGVATALSHGMATLPHDWDVVALEDLPDNARALLLPPIEGCENRIEDHRACPVLDLRHGKDAVPAAKRRKWRMAANRAARRGEVAIEHVEAGEAVGAFLGHLSRMTDARWRDTGTEGVFTDARVELFQQEALPLLVDAGIARLYLLSIGDTVAGAYYGFRQGDHAYAYLGGYGTDFAHESPGTLLMGHAIAEAVREGATAFHFLRGDEPYKFDWGAAEAFSKRRTFARSRP